MKYLSITAVKKIIPTLQFPISELEKVQLMQQIKDHFPAYTSEDLAYFFQCQQLQETQVFVGWIESDSFLRETLVSGKIAGVWKDVNQFKQHQLYTEFTHFITPFLYPIFKENLEGLNAQRTVSLLSYSYLLDENAQNIVQDVLSDWFNQKMIQVVDYCSQLKTDSQIHERLHQEINEAFITGLNTLNDRHYGVRMEVMERLFKLLYHKSSSRRLALYILGLAKSLHLSKDHQTQVQELESDLKHGKIAVEKSKISWLRLSLVVLLILLVGGLVTYSFFIDANPQEYAYQEETSFMEFSEKERHKLDSLIGDIQEEQRSMNGNPRFDSNLPFIGQQLVHKRDWTNMIYRKMERSWAGNDTVVQTKLFSKSTAYTLPYPGTKSLGLLNGQIKSEFHNNGTQTVLLVIFQNTKQAPVYTKYVHAKSKLNFTCNAGEIVLAIPGSKVDGHMHFGDLPFKEVNYFFYESLSNPYRIRFDNNQHMKLVWETMGSESYLLDVTESLENY